MQSLRSVRRPSAGAPRRPRPAGGSTAPAPGDSGSGGTPSKGAPAPRQGSRTRDARKSRVDDRIKKRMSMRYADISGPSDAMGVPAVPALPVGPGMGVPRATSGRRGGREEVDEDEDPYDGMGTEQSERRRMDAREREIRMLDEKGFNPDAFLKAKLANSTEAELKTLQSSLRQTKDDTQAELQKNVFKNYAEFVHISKEISALENEMLELKEALSEWKSMPSQMQVDDASASATSRRNVRSSVADLRVLYASQMQALHQQVEGSAKFVPTIPGRHVVAEVDQGVVALHPATYRPSHAVRFVILDDSVLVARKRQRRAEGGKGAGWVAERCWPLGEIVVLDTKDSPNLNNVIKMRYLKETHVYRTEQPGEKKALLAQLRHVGDELQSRRTREREGEHERRKTAWMGDRNTFFDPSKPGPDWMADLARQAGLSDNPSSGSADAKDKAERDARIAGDLTDELTVSIALREYERAVQLVEDGEKQVSTIPSLAPQLASLTANLTTTLLAALAQPSIRKAGTVRLIGLLTRIHAGPAARATFLKARGALLAKRVRAVPLRGDGAAYAHDLAVVVFTAIKHTAEWFLAACRINNDASAFVDWAREQVALFAEMFRRQVYGSDADDKVVKKALAYVHAQSKKSLEDFGIDFRFLLDDLLSSTPGAAFANAPLVPSAPPVFAPGSAKEKALALKSERSKTLTASSTPIINPPTPTTIRTRSPAPSTSSKTSTRSRSPMPPPSADALDAPTPLSASLRSPSPATPSVRTRSPAPSTTSTSSYTRTADRDPMPPVPTTPTPSAVRPSFSSTSTASSIPGARARPPRDTGSPAPPPRSRDRPNSASIDTDRGSAFSQGSVGSGGYGEGQRESQREMSAREAREARLGRAAVAVPRREGMF